MSVEKINNGHHITDRWTANEVLQLIDMVKECEGIYNRSDQNYFNRPYVENIWRQIDIRLGKKPGVSQTKWISLRTAFRREQQLLEKDKTEPSWAYFSDMLFLQPFLRKICKPNLKLESHIQEALQKIDSVSRRKFKKKCVANIEQCNIETTDSENSWSHSAEIKEEDPINVEGCFVDAMDADQMYDEFLDEIEDDVIEYASTCNGPQPPRASIVYLKNSDKTCETTSLDIEHYSQSHSLNRTHDSPTSSTCKKKRIEADDTSQEPDTMQTSRLNVPCVCKSNPDAMFLLSLMPDIEMLSRKNKGVFKIEVQRLIQNLLYPDE